VPAAFQESGAAVPFHPNNDGNCFAIQNGESLSSFILRRHTLSGRALTRDEIGPYVQYNGLSNDKGLRWRLWPFSGGYPCELVRGITLDQGRDLIECHAVVRALWPVFGPLYTKRIAESEWGDAGTPLIYGKKYATFGGSLPRYSTIRFCPECFKAQARLYGFAFYKVEWQFPFAICCEKHGCYLKSVRCNQCGYRPTVVQCLQRTSRRTCGSCGSDQWISTQFKPKGKESQRQEWVTDQVRSGIGPFSSILLRFLYACSVAKRGAVNCGGVDWRSVTYTDISSLLESGTKMVDCISAMSSTPYQPMPSIVDLDGEFAKFWWGGSYSTWCETVKGFESFSDLLAILKKISFSVMLKHNDSRRMQHGLCLKEEYARLEWRAGYAS